MPEAKTTTRTTVKNRPEVALRPWEGPPFHNSTGPGLIYRSKTVPVYNRWDVTLYEGLSGTWTIKVVFGGSGGWIR